MKKETSKTIALCLAMAFMFCMGSHLNKSVPYFVQAIIGILMVVFSILARVQNKKRLEQ